MEADERAALGLARQHRPDLAAEDLRRDRPGVVEDLQRAGVVRPGHHCFEHRRRGPRLERERAHPGVAGVERSRAVRGRGQTVGAAVVGADPVAQLVVRRGAAERLDVLVLVEGGDALGGDLPAGPRRFFGQADAQAEPGGAQGRGNAAEAGAADEHVTGDLRNLGGGLHPPPRRGYEMLMEIDLTSVYSCMPCRPPSRPSPLSLTPPNGISCVYPVASFTQTRPYSSASPTRTTRARSRDER